MPSTAAARPTLVASAGSDLGRRRENNEDRYHCDPVHGVFAVVDGVGGQAAGEKAAETALTHLRARLERQTGSPADRVREAITLANNEVYRLAASDPALEGMACVLTVALVRDGRLTIGHVGDTRLYGFADGTIRKLTHDHSPVGEREDRGELAEAEAMRHPRRNEIFRDVGSGHHEPADAEFIEVIEAPFEPDHAILLCSDGLTDLVPSSAIASIVHDHADDPDAVVERLIGAANEAGGKDNVTVIFAAGPRFAVAARRHRGTAGQARLPASRAAGPAGAVGRGGWLLRWAPVLFLSGLLLGLGAAWALLASDDALADRLTGAFRPAAWHRTWTVGADGTDDVRTIAEALTRAAPGDVIEVGPGEYDAPLVIAGDVSLVSRRTHEAIIRPPEGAQQPWTALTIRSGSRVRVAGLAVRGDAAHPLSVGVRVEDAVVELDGLDVAGAVAAGFALLPRSRATIRSCHVHDNAGAGIVVERDALPRLLHNVVTNNGRTPASPRAGLEVREGAVPFLFGNIIVRNGENEIAGAPAAARTEWQLHNIIGMPAAPGQARPRGRR